MGSELKNCPFCCEELRHVESWARSFQPNRLYHEYHHPENDCVLKDMRKYFTDDRIARERFIAAWNTRPDAPAPEGRRPFADAPKDGRGGVYAIIKKPIQWRPYKDFPHMKLGGFWKVFDGHGFEKMRPEDEQFIVGFVEDEQALASYDKERGE